jgi:hypothetical protein
VTSDARLQATRLAGRIDQIIGWAKAGKNEEYYAMDIEIALSGAAKTERGEGR